MAQERANVTAGIFVLVGIVLALGVVFVLSDFERLFERQQTIVVSYHLSDGLQGLKEGAAITIGDQPVGAITRIADRYADDRITGKLVYATLPKRFNIYQNAEIELVAPPFGSGTRLNIRSVGDGRLHTGEPPIEGGLAGSPLTKNFVRDLGIEEQQRQQIQTIIANAEKLTATLRDDVPALTARVQAVLAKAEPLLDDANAAMTNLKAASADIKALTGDLDQRRTAMLDRFDSILTNSQQLTATARDLLKDKDPALRQTIDNVHDISRTARETTMAQVTATLEKARSAMENLNRSTQELRTLIVGQRPVLERALANAQLTTDQLKLAAVEVRRSPWRLLYSPKDEELETDNLYDAARSFALAAGTLDAAARSLQQVSRDTPEDRERVARMLDHLEAIFSRFEETEGDFWKALKRGPGKGTGTR